MLHEPAPPARVARLHADGRLSFRRRVPRPALPDAPDLPLVPCSENPPRLGALVPPGFARVEIEVGPGKGTFLLAATDANPDTFFVGVDAAPDYARYTAERLAKTGRRNGVLLIDNAKQYLRDSVDAGAVDRIHVYFPDPWPKRRHRKRRFFTADAADDLCRILKPGGLVLAATDNPAYAGQICAVLGGCPRLARDEAEEERLCAMPPGHGFSPSNFEKKYREQGRIIRRYAFRRSAS